MSGIRLGDIPDISAICSLASELHKSSSYANIKPDEPKFRLFLASLMGMKKGTVILIVDDNNKPQGFLFGMVEELFFSRQQMATDIAMYVRKGYRNLAPSMVKKFIEWAKQKPRMAQIILGVSSGIGNPDRTGKMYHDIGFNQVGGIHIMNIARAKPCQQSL